MKEKEVPMNNPSPEITFETVNKKGDKIPFSIMRDKINYYRAYVNTDEKKGKPLQTIVFLTGSSKGLIIDISYYDFQAILYSKYTPKKED